MTTLVAAVEYCPVAVAVAAVAVAAVAVVVVVPASFVAPSSLWSYWHASSCSSCSTVAPVSSSPLVHDDCDDLAAAAAETGTVN